MVGVYIPYISLDLNSRTLLVPFNRGIWPLIMGIQGIIDGRSSKEWGFKGRDRVYCIGIFVRIVVGSSVAAGCSGRIRISKDKPLG